MKSCFRALSLGLAPPLSFVRMASRKRHFNSLTNDGQAGAKRAGGKVYAVQYGRTTGLFHSWKECEDQVCDA